MFSHDRPIQNLESDILGRKRFAQELAEAIFKADSSESLVLSINGDWGSGKSSLINMVKDECINKYKDDIKVINFNPWFYTDRANLILKFFETLCAQEKFFNNAKKKKKVFETINFYASNFENIASVIPFASSGVKAIKETSRQLSKKYESKLANAEELRDRIRKLFLELDHKILIVIDDIDRLSSREIRDIFQLVKLVADIPKIIYLLSFDRTVVCKALDQFQVGKGEDYLEKIIQVPFELPQYDSKTLEDYLIKKINNVLGDIPNSEIEMYRWHELFREGMRGLFKTLRHINRYINILGFDFPLVKNQVNIVDFLGITAIKVFYPELYKIVKNNKSIFLKTGGEDRYSTIVEMDTKGEFKEEIEKLLKHLKLDHFIKSILVALFPKTGNVLGDKYHSSQLEHENVYRKMQRVCSEECFDIYFHLDVPSNIITNQEMEVILNSSEHEINNILKGYKDADKITSFLDRLEDFTSEIPITDILKIINPLLDLGDTFPEKIDTDWVYRVEIRIGRITYQLLKRIEDKGKRRVILYEAIKKAEKSLYVCVSMIADLDSQHGRFGRADQKLRKEDVLVDENELDKLEKLGKKKIEEWYKNGKLINAKRMLYILYRWKEWGGDKEIDNFIKSNCEDLGKIINLLVRFLSRVSVQSSRGYETSHHFEIHFKDAKTFLDVDNIYAQLKKLKPEEIKKYSSEEQEAIRLFIDNYEGKAISRR